MELKKIEALEDNRIVAASGLFGVRDDLYLVCDDCNSIFKYSLNESWQEFPILGFEKLPLDHAERKAKKADFESLILSPFADNKLLAVPSGSKSNRKIGLHFDLVTQQAEWFSLESLFDEIQKHIIEINIEGAFTHQGDLYLLNRGVGEIKSEILKIDLKSYQLKAKFILDLPLIEGVPSHGTELCFYNGEVFMLFCAEKTLNSYDDGPILGWGFASLDLAKFQIKEFQVSDLKIKPEGLVHWNGAWQVSTDPDGHGLSQFFKLMK